VNVAVMKIAERGRRHGNSAVAGIAPSVACPNGFDECSLEVHGARSADTDNQHPATIEPRLCFSGV